MDIDQSVNGWFERISLIQRKADHYKLHQDILSWVLHTYCFYNTLLSLPMFTQTNKYNFVADHYRIRTVLIFILNQRELLLVDILVYYAAVVHDFTMKLLKKSMLLVCQYIY